MSAIAPSLPFPAHNVRASDPATSHLAAAGSPGREQIASTVRTILAAHPEGLTDWKLWQATGLPERLRGSVVKRRQDAHATDTGVTRMGPSGRPMTVWTLPR